MTPDTQRSRFVILHHDHPVPHLDLLMQDGDVLKAWRLLDEFRSGTWLTAQTLPDHRLMYLDYEGPISGNRGTVSRLTSGTYNTLPDAATAEKTFALLDCPLATQAACRDHTSASPSWRFS